MRTIEESRISRLVETPISFHCVYEDSIQEALQLALNHGFKGIQVALEVPHLARQLNDEGEIQSLMEFCDEHHLYITLHGYDNISSFYCMDRNFFAFISRHFGQLFHWTTYLKSSLLTLHLGIPPSFPQSPRDSPKRSISLPPASLEQLLNGLKQNLQRLVSLRPPKLSVCIENYQFNSWIYPILEPFLQDGTLSLCWDVPKTFSRAGILDQEMWDFMEKYHQCIKQIHLHDLHPERGSHLTLGEGILDFKHLLTAFPLPNVQDICFEVRPFQQALKSKEQFFQIFQT
jgi:sugar phosphate isomerase/epimerase